MRLSPPRTSVVGWAAAIVTFIVTLAFTALPAHAQTTTAPKDPESLTIPEGSAAPTSIGGDGAGTLLRLGLGLVVVIGLIAAVWYVMKRVQRSRFPALEERSTALIDVVTTTQLGPNRAVHLIRVGEELVLVGATDHTITALARLGADDALALVDLAPPAPRFGAPHAGPGGPGVDDRARAVATANDGTLVERLRAMTTRR